MITEVGFLHEYTLFFFKHRIKSEPVNSSSEITSDTFCDAEQDASPLQDHSCTAEQRNLTIFGTSRNSEGCYGTSFILGSSLYFSVSSGVFWYTF